jgi:hypothetical protein
MKSKGVWIRRTYPLSRRSCWLLKENTQVSEFLINDLSGQNRSIRFGKPDYPVLDPDMSGPPHRIPVRITGLIRPSFQTCPASYQKSQFHAKSSQIGWSLQIHLISVIVWSFCVASRGGRSLIKKASSWILSKVIFDQYLELSQANSWAKSSFPLPLHCSSMGMPERVGKVQIL